jgi:4'-phosphopantetheinyl transferase
MTFQRNKMECGPVQVHCMSFSDFDPGEYLEQLTGLERERFFSFTNLQRQREFVATRILRHNLFGHQHIHYDSVGAPFIEEEGYISISHSKNCVGLALCEEFKVGLDIENIQEKITRVQHKFLSENEKMHLDCDSVSELTKVWSGKECLYKISGRQSLNFRLDLELQKRTENSWIGIIKGNTAFLKTELNIFELENRIISVNITPCERTTSNLFSD